MVSFFFFWRWGSVYLDLGNLSFDIHWGTLSSFWHLFNSTANRLWMDVNFLKLVSVYAIMAWLFAIFYLSVALNKARCMFASMLSLSLCNYLTFFTHSAFLLCYFCSHKLVEFQINTMITK